MTAVPDAPARSLPSNPFATRFTQPGVLPPCDPEGMPIDVAALAAGVPHAGALAIVAPHGHGKTTLLLAVLRDIGRAGRPTSLHRIATWRDAWRLPAGVAVARNGGVIGVDGWDAVPKPVRSVVCLLTRLRRQTLLVTAHAPCGLPELARPHTSARLLAALVARLPSHGGRIAPDEIDAAFQRHGGNLRDALFDLYDHFERRIR